MIPKTPEEITADWISEAFAPRFPGAHASAVEVVDAHSGTTGRARLRIDWKEDGGAPSSVFAKLAPTDEIQREMVITTGMGKREARFYHDLAADMPVRVAAPYSATWTDDGGEYLMLMEDLGESGCSIPRRSDPEVPDYARWMMDALAQLHAHFRASPRFGADLSWIDPPMQSDFGPLMVRSAVEQFGDEMPPEFHEMARIYCDHNEAVGERLDAGTQTLIHGDSHLGNLFLDGERIGFLDWACLCRAPGLRDVAYFLCNSIPTELRRSDERALLDRYRAGLDDPPSADDAFRDYRLYAICSWVAATVTAAAGSRMQPIEIGMSSMRRATDALIDLETPQLFREELSVP
jgi:hypothetical protein